MVAASRTVIVCEMGNRVRDTPAHINQKCPERILINRGSVSGFFVSRVIKTDLDFQAVQSDL